MTVALRLTILGCGTSSGVPRIGGDWGACDPGEPRNAHTRASIVVRSATTTILVDTGPDMRGQLLAAGVGKVDAVIWTHEHADHTHGIDDLRQLFHARGTPLPGYARADTLALLQDRFPYVFSGRDGYPASVTARTLDDRQTIGDILVSACDMPHGTITSAGLRFDLAGRSIGYATDFSGITGDMTTMFEDVDVWVADALRYKPHPTHPHLSMTLAAAVQLRAKRTLLTHMDQSMDYRALTAALPEGVEPGYDGLEIELG